MRVIQDDLWLCDDCTIIAVNGDYTGIDYHYKGDEAEQRIRDIDEGLARLGPHLVSDDGDEDEDTPEDERRESGRNEFSWQSCDCCLSHLGGARTRFAVLGD